MEKVNVPTLGISCLNPKFAKPQQQAALNARAMPLRVRLLVFQEFSISPMPTKERLMPIRKKVFGTSCRYIQLSPVDIKLAIQMMVPAKPTGIHFWDCMNRMRPVRETKMKAIEANTSDGVNETIFARPSELEYPGRTKHRNTPAAKKINKVHTLRQVNSRNRLPFWLSGFQKTLLTPKAIMPKNAANSDFMRNIL